MKYKIILVTGLLLVGMQIHAMGEERVGEGGKSLTHDDSCVSYIYYPKVHAEIEIEGIAYDSIFGHARSLQNMIQKSTSDGNPFLRFAFRVNPEQVENIKKYINESSWGTCAMRALGPLAKAGVCTVPFPISVSPLLSAAYLASGKQLGINNVSKIEYYGNPSALKNIMKIVPGVSQELVVISLVCAMSHGLIARELLLSQGTAIVPE